jgi:hypothetical protein
LTLGGTDSGTLASANAGSEGVTTAVTIADGTGLASNYILTQPTLANVTISQAPLSVTANNASKTYDGLAYTGGNGVAYSGFVNSETNSVLGGTPAYGGSSQGAINANSYVITPSGLTSGNYTISYVNGALTVNPASLTVSGLSGTDRVFNGTTVDALNGTAVLNGLIGSETLTLGGTASGTLASANAGSESVTTAVTIADGSGLASNYMLIQPTLAPVHILPLVEPWQSTTLFTQAGSTLPPALPTSQLAQLDSQQAQPLTTYASNYGSSGEITQQWGSGNGPAVTILDGGVRMPNDRDDERKDRQ